MWLAIAAFAEQGLAFRGRQAFSHRDAKPEPWCVASVPMVISSLAQSGSHKARFAGSPQPFGERSDDEDNLAERGAGRRAPTCPAAPAFTG